MNAYPSDEQVVSNKQGVELFKLPKNASEIKAMLKVKLTHYNKVAFPFLNFYTAQLLVVRNG